MIEGDRVRELRGLRVAYLLMACMGVVGIINPFAEYKNIVIALFAGYFVFLFFDHTARIRAHRLSIDDLPVRDRRRTRMK